MAPELHVKTGVILAGLKPEMARTVIRVMLIYSEYGVPAVITSGLDGHHSSKSLHYVGLALDWRTRHLPGGYLGPAAHAVREQIAAVLGDDYDVVLEKDHIHVEYDPE